MPIGTIIGWLIGQLIIGFIVSYKNSGAVPNMTEATALCRQTSVVVGNILLYTAFYGLVGTVIESILR